MASLKKNSLYIIIDTDIVTVISASSNHSLTEHHLRRVNTGHVNIKNPSVPSQNIFNAQFCLPGVEKSPLD
jgi:hypothetical protein